MLQIFCSVATAPTVYGIETGYTGRKYKKFAGRLQQHLPFTVLKRIFTATTPSSRDVTVATAPTVYGIETKLIQDIVFFN